MCLLFELNSFSFFFFWQLQDVVCLILKVHGHLFNWGWCAANLSTRLPPTHSSTTYSSILLSAHHPTHPSFHLFIRLSFEPIFIYPLSLSEANTVCWDNNTPLLMNYPMMDSVIPSTGVCWTPPIFVIHPSLRLVENTRMQGGFCPSPQGLQLRQESPLLLK